MSKSAISIKPFKFGENGLFVFWRAVSDTDELRLRHLGMINFLSEDQLKDCEMLAQAHGWEICKTNPEQKGHQCQTLTTTTAKKL